MIKQFILLIFLFSGMNSYAKCDGSKAVNFKSEKTFAVNYIYSPRAKTDKSVILLHPTGGINYIDRSYAKQLCRAGFKVYVFEWEKNEPDPENPGFRDLNWEIHEKLYLRIQEALKLTLKNIDTKFVGVLGTSAGGIYAAQAMSLHKRIDAALVIVAGVPIYEILGTSDQDVLVKMKKIRDKRYGLKTKSEYAKKLEQVIHTDVSKLPKLFKNKDLGVFMASKDKTVPYKYQAKLKDMWKPQMVIEKNNDHFWAIVNFWWSESETMIKFFENSAAKKNKFKQAE